MFETTGKVGEDGMVHLAVPGVTPGLVVRIIVDAEPPKIYREPGGLKGKIRIAPDFDDPIPEMEPYS